MNSRVLKRLIKFTFLNLTILLLSPPCFKTPLIYASDSSERVINTSKYILYLPSGLDSGKKYPLVLALSPGADAESMLKAWGSVSEEYKWIILASREHRNGMEFKKIGDLLTDTLLMVEQMYPVDPDKVIATGFSGGGMSAHYLAYEYPDLIKAVVANTAMIGEYFSGQGKYKYPKNKIAVFLASPDDFRYSQMKIDNSMLSDFGWDTKWIEFSGGHTIAPKATYHEAAQWLKDKL